MNELLQLNQTVATRSGLPCKVLKFLGGGGQGEVYRVKWGTGESALKWYYPQTATREQRTALEELVKMGAPNQCFLWPQDIAEDARIPGYGYLMPLRSERYKNLNDLVSGRIDPSFLALIRVGIELTIAFRSLHNRGLCYRDISFGNAFFDPGTGEVLVCDNDNVTTNRTQHTGVLGTADFMAPEVVRMEAVPSRDTDLHSLAVLLFYILHINNPLCGKRVLTIRIWDMPARNLIYGKSPVFIFDPKDKSNAAVDKAHDPTGEAGGNALLYWSIWPQVLRDTFTTAFTTGLQDPSARVDELNWLHTLIDVRNSLYRCACGTPNFYDMATYKATAGGSTCWRCGKKPTLPFRIRIGRSVIMLNSDTQLFKHHLGSSDFDLSTVVAEVKRHPTDPNVWGLKNLTAEKWVATMADGKLKDVDPGKSVPLASGVKVAFGHVDGDIRY